MGHVVNKIRTHFDLQSKPEKELSKVKGDQDAEWSCSSKTYDISFSPIKTIRFNINGYFKKIKESSPVKRLLFYLDEKKSVKTTNT